MVAVGCTDDDKVMQSIGMRSCKQVYCSPLPLWPATKYQPQKGDWSTERFETAQLGPL